MGAPVAVSHSLTSTDLPFCALTLATVPRRFSEPATIATLHTGSLCFPWQHQGILRSRSQRITWPEESPETSVPCRRETARQVTFALCPSSNHADCSISWFRYCSSKPAGSFEVAAKLSSTG